MITVWFQVEVLPAGCLILKRNRGPSPPLTALCVWLSADLGAAAGFSRSRRTSLRGFVRQQRRGAAGAASRDRRVAAARKTAGGGCGPGIGCDSQRFGRSLREGVLQLESACALGGRRCPS